jgi:hypothetical protein
LYGGGVPPQMVQEKPLAENVIFTFYTFSNANIPSEDRWRPTGIPDVFFDNPEQAHRVLLEIRDEVSSDPEMEWTVMNLEKVETVPVSRTNILALLNEGVGSFIQKYEIIDRVGPK